jgi:hypothetical protein
MSFAKKSILTIIATALLLAIVLGIAGIVYEEVAVAKTLEQINKQLSAKLLVKEVKLSLLKEFPKVSITLKRVEILEGSIDNPPELETGLMSIEEITIRMCLIDVIKKNYKIERITFSNGWISLYHDSFGIGNYEILSSQNTTTSNIFQGIGAVRFRKINLSYIDLKTGWVFKGLLKDAFFRGSVAPNNFLLNVAVKSEVGSLKQRSFHFMRNQKVNFNSEIIVSDSLYLISPSFGSISSNKLSFKGTVGRHNGSQTHLLISGSNFGIESVLSFFSQNTFKLPANTKTKGGISFNITAYGVVGEDNPIRVDVDFLTPGIQMLIPNKPIVKINQLSGTYTNGALGNPESSEIFLNEINLESGNTNLKGTLRVKNILSPLYHLKVNHLLYIPDLLSWGVRVPLNNGVIYGNSEAIGTLESLNDISKKSFENTKFYSSIDLRQLSFEQVGSIPELKDVSGTLTLSSQDICSASMEGVLHGSNFRADIQATNATAILFENQMVTVNANITIDSLNTDWLLNDKPKKHNQEPENSTWNQIQSITGDVFIDKFIHKRLEVKPLSATFDLKRDQLFCNSFLARSSSGLFTGKFNVATKPENVYDLAAEVNIEGANVQQLFESFNNFNQTVLTSYNISGQLDGILALSASLKGGQTIPSRIEASANLEVSNGQIVELEPFVRISEFAHLNELRNLRYSLLKNRFTIKEEKIVIPDLVIQTPSASFFISGIHYFSGENQYYVKLLLSESLSQKANNFKPENAEFIVPEKDGSGKESLFLKLEGDSVSRKVSYSGMQAWENFRQNQSSLKDSLGRYSTLSIDTNIVLKKDSISQGNTHNKKEF